MSGSNWIPASNIYPESSQYYNQLLDLAASSGIKMLRVWGGGYYESDEFYTAAAERGITIWQDFMFACATYSNSSDYLASVTAEVTTQLWKLTTHPAVVVLAGNNENEVILATNVFGTNSNKDFYYGQYRQLYIQNIRQNVLKANLTIPFVSSSPSNGILTGQYGATIYVLD